MLEWHYTLFKMEWITRSGNEFQAFFEGIMGRQDPSFCPVAPAGSLGDQKSDGYRTSDGTNHQVYAPEIGMENDKACAKIKADFEGAVASWPEMKRWVFVWSSPRGGLPPGAVQLIAALNAERKDVEVLQWGLEDLWKVVRGLSELDRNDLLRPFPDLAVATRPAVASDISSLLNSVVSMQQAALSDDLSLTPPQAKLDRNGLGRPTEMVIKGAIGLLPTVRQVAEKHPDPGFAPRVAAALRGLYEGERNRIEDADALFFSLVETVAGDAKMSDEKFWAAAAIVTRAFEICDVFER